MAKPNEPYFSLIVESYIEEKTSGLHGSVHIRPVAGEVYPTTMRVQCSKELSRNYPVGTRFRIRAKLTDREEGGEFLYSRYSWPFEVLAYSEAD